MMLKRQRSALDKACEADIALPVFVVLLMIGVVAFIGWWWQ